MNRIRIPKSWILLAVFIVSVIGAEAWVFTTPPDGHTDLNGSAFGNTSNNANNYTADRIDVMNYFGTVVGTSLDSYSCDASYCIYQPWYAPGQTYAKNVSTGLIDYIGTFPSVANSALSHGSIVKVIGAVNNIAFTSTININNGNTLDLTGATLTISSISAPPITVNSGGMLLGGTIDANSVSALNGGLWHYIRVAGGTVDGVNLSKASLGMAIKVEANGSVIKNSVFSSNAGNTQPAIWFAPSVGNSDVMYNKVSGGWYDGIYGSNNSKIIGNTIYNITHGGIYTPNLGQNSVDISFNTVYSNGENGIDVNTSHATVYGNLVYNNSWNGIAIAGYNNTVSNNIVYSNNQANAGRDGIRLQSWTGLGDTSYNTISNNVVYDPSTTQTYAIGESNIGGTAGYPDYNYISGNTVIPGKTGVFNRIGAHTNILNNPGGNDDYNVSKLSSTSSISAATTISANGLMYSGVQGSVGGSFLAYTTTSSRYTQYQGTGVSGTGGLFYTDASGTSSNQDYIIRSTGVSGALVQRAQFKTNCNQGCVVYTNLTIPTCPDTSTVAGSVCVNTTTNTMDIYSGGAWRYSGNGSVHN